MPYTKGAQKAMAAMRKRYGANWKSVFYGHAMRFGKGRSPHARANSVYTKGHHQVKRARSRRKRR